MARTGVTAAQVAAAADELLMAGERPTIERVRALMGTGSPNTLIKHLDSWWRGLGPRLNEQRRLADLPGAPREVAEGAFALWQLALKESATIAQTGVQEEKKAIDAAREALRARELELAEAERISQERVSLVEADLRLSDVRLSELEQTCAQKDLLIQTLAGDLDRERDANLQLSERLGALTKALDAARLQAISDRDAATAHIRAYEDRAYIEIDRARQEATNATKHVARLTKELADTVAHGSKRIEELLREISRRDAELAAIKVQLAAATAKKLKPSGAKAALRSKRPAPRSSKAAGAAAVD